MREKFLNGNTCVIRGISPSLLKAIDVFRKSLLSDTIILVSRNAAMKLLLERGILSSECNEARQLIENHDEQSSEWSFDGSKINWE